MSGFTWTTLFMAGALGSAVLLAEAGFIGLFFQLIYGRRDRGPITNRRFLAMFLVLAVAILVPPGAQLLWYALPGHEPGAAQAARPGTVRVASATASFSLGKAAPERGRLLFQEQNCLACHRVQGRGGNMAPDLWQVGNRREAEWIFRHFQDPQGVSPGTLMPRFPLSDDQFRDLIAYLLSLRD